MFSYLFFLKKIYCKTRYKEIQIPLFGMFITIFMCVNHVYLPLVLLVCFSVLGPNKALFPPLSNGVQTSQACNHDLSQRVKAHGMHLAFCGQH